MEIVLNDAHIAAALLKLMARLNLEARLTERKASQVLYIKEAETIVDFLRTVGASKPCWTLKMFALAKSIRNNVNRQVNFETANLAKTVDASVRQMACIKQIVDSYGWDGIPAGLRNLAELRLEFPIHPLENWER